MNNQATVIGTIETEFVRYIENHNEWFYQFFMSIRRTSGSSDLIPVIVSERLIDMKKDCTGRQVYINGQFRSYNAHNEATGKTSLLLYLFPQEIELIDNSEDFNDIYLEGYICKKPTYRKTPLGREISDVLLAVNRKYGKSDYIPCIMWGRNASFASGFAVGLHIRINGRLQSREYSKNDEIKTVYEVSTSMVEIIE